MECVNKIELVGRVDNISRTRIADTEVVRFAVATTYEYYDKTECTLYEVTWHNVSVWKDEKNADVLDKIKNGIYVRVVGRLRSVRFTDSEGRERTSYEVFAREVSIVK